MATRVMERDWKEQTLTILGKVYDYKVLSAEMKDMAGFLGFGTKLVDNLAGMKAYSQEEKLKKVDKVYDALLQDNWRTPGEGNSLSGKKEREKIFAAYAQASKAQQKIIQEVLKGQYEFPVELDQTD